MALIDEVLLTDVAHLGDFIKTSKGDQDILSGLRNMRNALFHRLLTVPGTLIHRPDYGVGIKRYQNAVNTIAVQQQLAIKIKDNFLRDDRVESVLGVLISYTDEKPELVEIKVRVKIRGYEDPAQLTFIPFQGEVI